MTNNLKDAALAYAARGWHIFPLVANAKTPLCKWRDESTTDPDKIATWWDKSPKSNIGLDCGKSGLFVVDLDVKNGQDGPGEWDRLGFDSGTAMSRTPSHGIHVIYRANGSALGNSASKLAPGIDTRGEGGYIVLPPSEAGGEYLWIDDREPLTVPAPLVGALTVAKPTSNAPLCLTGNSTPYGLKALDAECAIVSCASKGTRNNTLNTSAFKMGQLVGGGELAESDVVTMLERAARELAAEDGAESVLKTIGSGLERGKLSPRKAPEDARAHVYQEPPPEYGDEDYDIGFYPKKSAKSSPNLDSRGTSWAQMAKVIGPIEWEWEPWLPKGLLVELVGESGTGKSILALHIAGCFLRGDPWPDGTPFKGETGKVLWCEAESAQAINLERATEWGLPLDRIIAPLDDPLGDVRIDDKDHLAAITKWAKDPEVKLVVLDSLSGLHGGDENAVKMMETVKTLASLARDTGKPFMLLHHLRKRGMFDVGGKGISLDRVRGSSAIVQTARVVWALDVPDGNAAETKRLSVIKNNLARFPEPIGVTCDDDGVEFVSAPHEERRETLETRAVDLLYALLSNGAMTVPDLKDNFDGAGISWRTATRAGHKINVTMFKRKGDGLWVWSLPVIREK